ncbi:MAG: phosphoribosylanthranilate isomerase [Armatimonadota bacterium]|jgi:phosphoribosylanthranilate isomerase
MSIDVKICGNRTPEDAELTVSAGADFAGVILHVPQSPRSVTVEQAAQVRAACSIPLVVVFLDAPSDQVRAACDVLSPFAVQLHGGETPGMVAELKRTLPCQVWKVVHSRPGPPRLGDTPTLADRMASHTEAGADIILLDTAASPDLRGGTGLTSDWAAADRLIGRCRAPVFLAGGLDPDNVATAVAAARPAGVDVASGVESSPGVKSPDYVRAFVQAAKSAEAD